MGALGVGNALRSPPSQIPCAQTVGEMQSLPNTEAPHGSNT